MLANFGAVSTSLSVKLPCVFFLSVFGLNGEFYTDKLW